MHWTKVFLLLLLVTIAGCIREPSANYESALNKSSERVKQLGQMFVQETILLNQAAINYQQGDISLTQLKLQLANTRMAFKRIEFIAEYYYPEHIKAYINGAPLPHLDPYPYQELLLPSGYYSDNNAINIAPLDYQEPNAYIKQREVVTPEGLQTLDEIVFSEEAELQKEKIKILTNRLVHRTQIMQQALSKRRFIEDYQLFEAARLELIRIFTLGVSGFDTPGSNNALPEAASAVQSLQHTLTPLLNYLPDDQASSIEDLFSNATKTLSHSAFDSFNRLRFLTEHINPLYATLLEAHLQLNPTTSADLSPDKPSWNLRSKNLFAEDFINPYFYTILSKEGDSNELRLLGKKLFHEKN